MMWKTIKILTWIFVAAFVLSLIIYARDHVNRQRYYSRMKLQEDKPISTGEGPAGHRL